MKDDIDFFDVEDWDDWDCMSQEDGKLVFEPRDSLTEEEKELADLHIGCCVACQTDMEFFILMRQMEKSNSRW